jgi:3-oxoacyl-[acyl-carrier-protein] synthase II
MIQPRRVVITGIGLVTPLGMNIHSNWQNLLEGQSGIGPIRLFDANEFSVHIAGEVSDFDPLQWLSKKEARRMDRFIQFAVAASMMALEDAGIDLPLTDPERCGTLIGVGLGGLETLESAAKTLASRGPSRLSPLTIPRLIANLAPGYVSILLGTQGPNLSSVSACATGAHSIGDAARLIAWGDADLMIAGGSEATITPLGIGGFAAMKALSTRNDEPQKASRPFDVDRDGFVSSEGSGILILESLDHALARNAQIYAEFVGYGQSSDAYHITQPPPDGRGAKRAILNALRDAQLNPEDVDYVNAHGTSTPAGDIAESQAIQSVFDGYSDQLWVSSTKSMLGHMLGAAGAVELAICALAIKKGQVPPTINLDRPDPQCTLDYVPHHAREKEIKVALSNSFGFGGTNVSLVIKAWDGKA